MLPSARIPRPTTNEHRPAPKSSYLLKTRQPVAGHPVELETVCLSWLIIQTIRRDPSGSVWIDEASDVRRPDRSEANQIDAEHQPSDLAVGGSNPSRRASITAAQRPYRRNLVDPDPVEPIQVVLIEVVGDDADGDGGDRRP